MNLGINFIRHFNISGVIDVAYFLAVYFICSYLANKYIVGTNSDLGLMMLKPMSDFFRGDRTLDEDGFFAPNP